VQINKPTFNLQINNNVGNVNNSDGGALTMITKNGAYQHQMSDPVAQMTYLDAQKLLEVV